MRRVLIGGGAVALVVAGLGATWWTAVRPWTTLPADRAGIEARWKDVVAWAAPLDVGVEAGNERLGADPEKARASLAAATAAIGAVRIDVENIVFPNGAIAAVEREALPEGARTALDALRAWDAAGGAMRAEPCADAASGGGGADAIAMLTLVRTIIAVAKSPDDEELLAGLNLARAMRRNGTLLEATVGVSLVKTFAEVATARGWPATEQLVLLRPRPEELFAAVAREAVCVDRLFPQNPQVAAGAPLAVRALGAKQATAFLERERLLYRDFHARRLAELYPRRAELDAIESALRIPAPDALPKSLTLRASLIDGSSIVAQWRNAIEADRVFFRDFANRVHAGPVTSEGGAINTLRRVWFHDLATVLGPAPGPTKGLFSARREPCRDERNRMLETLGRPALAAHTVHGGIEKLERDGDCWSVVTGAERENGVFAVIDAADGAALLVWRVPEG